MNTICGFVRRVGAGGGEGALAIRRPVNRRRTWGSGSLSSQLPLHTRAGSEVEDLSGSCSLLGPRSSRDFSRLQLDREPLLPAKESPRKVFKADLQAG